MKRTGLLSTAVVVFSLATSGAAFAQDAGATMGVEPAASDEIAISPSRLELTLAPGSEKTSVINIVYSSPNATNAKPSRLLASLGDWSLAETGDLQFFKQGDRPNSATKWLLYSPGEFTAMPGKTSQIRLTVAVPKDTPPGDYHSVMFVEERPGNLKEKKNRKELTFHFRLSTIVYVGVPPLTTKPELKGLTAAMTVRGVVVTPTISNTGNSHVRPTHSYKVLGEGDKVVAEFSQPEGFPILRESVASPQLVAPAQLPPGEYQVRYRVDFADGSPIKEGRTHFTVGVTTPDAPKPAPDAKKPGATDAGRR